MRYPRLRRDVMSAEKKQPITRSGTRVPCNIPVTVRGLDPDDRMPAPCVIILANPQGCAAKCSRSIPVGTRVQIDGLPTESLVTARVVNCIDIHSETVWLLGLALEEPRNVWCIPSPPKDWLEPE